MGAEGLPVTGFQGLFLHEAVGKFNPHSRSVFGQLASCHTGAKGYQLLDCDNRGCGHRKYLYHSCGNRHCPFCGSMKREAWVEGRTAELLPTAYYHVVFTLPHVLNSLILGNRKALFDALFATASKTLLRHGRNPEFLGGEIGVTMVLHTWGQDLSFHPHVHCIVTGGGFDEGGKKWVEAKRKNGKFLFPTSSLAKMYKAMFMEHLEKDASLAWGGQDREKLLRQVRFKKWNVYAKAPFGGPAQVIEYLGRYTHKVAITRHRILEVDDSGVRFKYRDYADGDKTKVMRLGKEEFLRRFELHILPVKFVKIRHQGFVRNRGKRERISQIRASMGLGEAKPKVEATVAVRMLEKYGKDIGQCPCCKTGRLVVVHDQRRMPREKASAIRTAADPIESFAPS